MPRILFFVLILLLAVYLIRYVLRSLGVGQTGPKCKSCRSCGQLFEDGVLCRFQGRETFKNLTHIRNCLDYRRK